MDWANDNAGSIELTGHLVAVGQRRLAIQNQIQQISVLQSLAEAQKRQQMEKELLEERQSVLYDISAALDGIKHLFDHEPARAYYEFLVLEEFVSPLGLEHRMFPSLEWKNHCNKTLTGISELRSWCNCSLSPDQIKTARNTLAKRKLAEKFAEDQKIQKQRLTKSQTRSDRISRKIRQNRRSCLFCLWLAVGFGLFGFLSLGGSRPEQKADEVNYAAIWCFIIACVFLLCFVIAGVEMFSDKKSLKKIEE